VAEIDIKSSGDLFRSLTEHRAGETVNVDYYRDGGKHTARVALR
jgi:S1-C subfamily serine protease